MWWYLGFVTEVGLAVAIPLVVGAFVGRWLDDQWISAPYATLGGIVVGVIVSFFNLAHRMKRMLAK